MSKTVPFPQSQHPATPYLTVKGAAQAIEFYTAAFGAREIFRLTGPDGRIGHAELAIGDSCIMLSDEYPDFGALGPHTIGGSPVKMHLYVDDADVGVQRALKAGATLVRPVKNEFYGDRTGMVADPFGFSWFIAARQEEVSPEEMQRRWAANFETAGSSSDPAGKQGDGECSPAPQKDR